MVVIFAAVDYVDLFIVVGVKVGVVILFFRAHFTKFVFASGPVRRKSEGCVS